MSSQMAQQFGRYNLTERIAVGGMAEIFKAKTQGAYGFSRDIVIKRILAEHCEDETFVEMFVQEARLAAMLQHPNIAQVLEFDQVGDELYIAMELVEGVDLRGMLSRSKRYRLPIPTQLTLFIVTKILKGLSYAHEFSDAQGPLEIVHRDISPHNILLSRRGEVKVTDFGIARLASQISFTSTGVLKGKAAYMAPEQTYTSRVDARADVFAVGVILWEMLCGRRLFKSSNEVLTLQRVREADITPPHQLNPLVSSALSDLVMWALQRDVEHRAPSARTLAHELSSFLDQGDHEEQLAMFLAELERQKQLSKQQRDSIHAKTTPSGTPSRDSLSGFGSSSFSHQHVSPDSIEALSLDNEPLVQQPERDTVKVKPSDYLGDMLHSKPTTTQETPVNEEASTFEQNPSGMGIGRASDARVDEEVSTFDPFGHAQEEPVCPQEDYPEDEVTEQTPLPQTVTLPPGNASEIETMAIRPADLNVTSFLRQDDVPKVEGRAYDPASAETEQIKLAKKSGLSMAKLALWGGISIFGLGTLTALTLLMMS